MSEQTTEAAECQNDHGPDGIIVCWNPGGPCPAGRAVCETCGPCCQCRPGEHPLDLVTPPASTSAEEA